MASKFTLPASVPLNDWLVNTVRPLLEQAEHVLLVGGPGLGKTTVAGQLAWNDVQWIRGRELHTAMSTGQEDRFAGAVRVLEAANGKKAPIFIDDLDLIFGVETYPLIDEIIRRRKGAVLVTATLPPTLSALADKKLFADTTWTRDLIEGYSFLFQQPDTHKVDPWVKDWQRVIANAVRSNIGDDPELAPSVAGWWTIVLHLTGGHPIMLAEALPEITRIEQNEKLPEGQAIDWRVWKGRYGLMEDHLLKYGIRRLRHALRWLEQSFPPALQNLEEFAAGHIRENELSNIIRGILVDSGLMHRGSMGDLVVSGAALRHYLAEGKVAGRIAADPSIELVARPAEENAGDIVIRVADASISVPVRDTLYKIVDALNRSKPHPMSIDELETQVAAKAGAVRSALQRLRDDLKELDVDGVIENIPGEGYRMGIFPILVPRDSARESSAQPARKKAGERK